MPMRFQSLDLNMGDNYVDKHRKSKKAAIIELVDRAMLNAPPPQIIPQENKQKLVCFEQ